MAALIIGRGDDDFKPPAFDGFLFALSSLRLCNSSFAPAVRTARWVNLMARRWLFDLLLKTGPVADRATLLYDLYLNPFHRASDSGNGLRLSITFF